MNAPRPENSPSSQAGVSAILRAASGGQAEAVAQLLPLVYSELRGLAQAALRRERPGHTLQATALVNEAYLKLIDQREAQWQNRAHFLAVAAQAIRRILVDHARGKKRDKRGGGRERLALPEGLAAAAPKDAELVALDEALQRLSAENEMEAKIIEMRFFADMKLEEIAAVLGINERTVRRHWNFAKAWLQRELSRNDSGPIDKSP